MEDSDRLHRARNICKGDQKGDSQYDPQEPIVSQWLQQRNTSQMCSYIHALKGDTLHVSPCLVIHQD